MKGFVNKQQDLEHDFFRFLDKTGSLVKWLQQRSWTWRRSMDLQLIMRAAQFCRLCNLAWDLWQHGHTRKLSTIFNNMHSLNDTPNFFLHKFISSHKMASHNMVLQGTVWCITYRNKNSNWFWNLQNNVTIRCWSMTSLTVTPCPLSWFAGSRIVNFIRDGTVFAYNSEIYNIGAHAQWFRVNRHPRQRSRSDERPPIAYWKNLRYYLAVPEQCSAHA